MGESTGSYEKLLLWIFSKGKSSFIVSFFVMSKIIINVNNMGIHEHMWKNGRTILNLARDNAGLSHTVDGALQYSEVLNEKVTYIFPNILVSLLRIFDITIE